MNGPQKTAAAPSDPLETTTKSTSRGTHLPNRVASGRPAASRASAMTGGHGREIAALLAAARAVPGKRAFPDAARAILRACRTNLGARSGLVAFRSAENEDFEVALRDPPDSGPLGAAGLSPTLRRLASRSFRSRRAVVSNSSATPKSPVGRPLSGRRPAPEGALVAPVVIGGRVEGFVGLVDRPGGFSPADGRLAEVFAAMVAAARLDRRTVDGLETDRTDLQREADENASHLRRAEETFRTLVENLPDVVARFDPDLRHLYVSPAVERVTGRSSKDFVGKTNRELGVSPDIVERWDPALRRVFATGRPERLEFTLEAPDATRRFDCRLVPEPGPEGTIPSVLSVARDVTDRWLANEAEKRARSIAEALREATVVLTRSLDRETVLANLLDRLRPLVPFDRARVMLLEGSSRVSIRAVFDGAQVVPLPPSARPGSPRPTIRFSTASSRPGQRS